MELKSKESEKSHLTAAANIPATFTCLLCVYCVFIVCLLCVYCVFIVFLLCVYCVFIVCLLCVV